MSIEILYLPETDFWLRPCLIFRDKFVIVTVIIIIKESSENSHNWAQWTDDDHFLFCIILSSIIQNILFSLLLWKVKILCTMSLFLQLQPFSETEFLLIYVLTVNLGVSHLHTLLPAPLTNRHQSRFSSLWPNSNSWCLRYTGGPIAYFVLNSLWVNHDRHCYRLLWLLDLYNDVAFAQLYFHGWL